jgi:phosphopantetheinyl transferase (holo-ACP synthase)
VIPGVETGRAERVVVGDDVVDLGDPAIAEHHRRERFVARVCAPDERARAGTRMGLWTLFAAKEAAYKALTKLGFRPGFAHREIVVARDLGSVAWRGSQLLLRVDCDDARAHAIAWNAPGEPPIARIEETGGRLEDAARALLCSLVADALVLPRSELAVVRDPLAGAWDGFGPPRVERRGAPVDADVSLSHDGRFVSAAVRDGSH